MAKFDEKNIITLIANPKIQILEAKIRGTIDNAKQVFQVSL
jgi:3-methyladenine DNA glycosylase Tag